MISLDDDSPVCDNCGEHQEECSCIDQSVEEDDFLSYEDEADYAYTPPHLRE